MSKRCFAGEGVSVFVILHSDLIRHSNFVIRRFPVPFRVLMLSRGIQLALFLLVMLGVYLAGNGRTQLFDRDEPRYAQCSRQMLQSGDWVVPRLYDELRTKKPPAIYWCQATAMAALGDNAFAARLPSAIAAVLGALLIGLWAGRELSPRHTIWAAFVLGSSLLMLWSGKNCLTDAVLMLCITGALACIYYLWQRRGGWPAVIGLAVATACGGLVKGPFILGVLASTCIALGVLAWFDRWRQRRRERRERPERGFEVVTAEPWPPAGVRAEGPTAVVPAMERTSTIRVLDVAVKSVVGLLIVVAIVAPWIYLVHVRAPQFLGAAKADAMNHLESGTEGHTGPPGYHLALVWVTFLPWSLLLPLAIGLAIKHRRTPAIRFALAAVLGTWVFVEILQTKLPHYFLPAFPWLAVLTADAILRCLKGEQRDLESLGIRIGSLVVGVVIVGLATVPWWWIAIKFHDFPRSALIPLTAFGLIYGTTVAALFWSRQIRSALVAMGGGSLGMAVLLFAVYLPQSQPLRLPIRVADVLVSHGVTHPHEAVMFEYKEPSLAFYQGGTIREYNESLQQFASQTGKPSWIVIPKWVWDEAPSQTRDAFEQVAPPIRGLDYSDAGKTVDVMVLHRN
jgi:4-amino-4-deoxy-L-arabinose transferase-like glycosyltransferase